MKNENVNVGLKMIHWTFKERSGASAKKGQKLPCFDFMLWILVLVTEEPTVVSMRQEWALLSKHTGKRTHCLQLYSS